MTRRLHVSDLDGTLLRPDASLGPHTLRIVNGFVADGGMFTIATARSFHAVRRLTAGLDLHLPVIVYDGAMVVDPATGVALRVSLLSEAQVRATLDLAAGSGLEPVLYIMDAGVDRYCWIGAGAGEAVRDFVGEPPWGPRATPVSGWDELDLSSVFYVAVPGQVPDRATAPDWQRHPEHGWDVAATGVSKGREVARLRVELDVDEVIVFGDGPNDLSMFDVADRSYAVADATPEAIRRASSVIGRSADDAVARWLSGSRDASLDM